MSVIEGWLQMPVERNLIGRAGSWKSRYVKFGIYSPTTPTSAVSALRPTTATGVVGMEVGDDGKLSGRRPQGAESNSNGIESAQLLMFLAIYKQKNDTEPIAQYPLASIASCYIGDVASRQSKKKSVVLPTLILNLRSETQLSSSKSFRRRSHDVPPREGVKKESSVREILYFRTAPHSDNAVAIEKWVKEIQASLLPSSSDSNTVNPVEYAFREKSSEDTCTSPPSLFFINGEPSTALLSPSLRSRASNLSSIESDDKSSIMSSSAPELPSLRVDEGSPPSSGAHIRPPLHVATKLRHSVGGGSNIKDRGFVNTPVALPARRETILDRFFSSTAPPSPSLSLNLAPMNSIDRFEALIRDIESGRDPGSPNDSLVFASHPKRIPSPTQRALEYVSTGLLKHSPESCGSTSLRSRLVCQEESPVNLSVGCLSLGPGPGLGQQPSQGSLGAIASLANGTVQGGEGVEGDNIESNLRASNSKRHSLVDISGVKLSTAPPLLQLAASRRGSYSDVLRMSESYEDGQSPIASTSGGDFNKHSRTTRPLFREFSF